jgi:steroid 5-alpha reductase family enzyme
MQVLPGKRVEGVPLEDGRRLAYKLNGLLAQGISVVLALALVFAGLLSPTLLFDEYAALVTTANIVTFAYCLYVYFVGRRQASYFERKMNPLEAFFVGATRNPRVGGFDLKFFTESRPGMILWVLICLSLAAAQYARHGTVTNSMILVCLFEIAYVTDYFIVEDAILSTWDIRHENFGWMLAWGCVVWVPFTYAIQALYLVVHPVELPPWGVVGISLLFFAGYFLFRQSNLQKHHFRPDPLRPIWGNKPEYIQTEQGGKLLISGWWGIMRHPNYLGDLMMGLAWCLCTGFDRILPYFYVIYFTILLVHREYRDAQHCARKYGPDWELYTNQVRWRILPGVY